VTLYEVSSNLNTVTRRSSYAPPGAIIDGDYCNSEECSITAGNFSGNNRPGSPTWDIAVSYLHRSTGHFRVSVIDVDDSFNMSAKGTYDLNQARSDFMGLPITAYDAEGDSVYLGAPVHLTLHDLVRTDYIIQEPPKHIDYIDNKIVNISRKGGFYVELKDSKKNTFSSSDKSHSNWTLAARGKSPLTDVV
jgi:hypothetical protein